MHIHTSLLHCPTFLKSNRSHFPGRGSSWDSCCPPTLRTNPNLSPLPSPSAVPSRSRGPNPQHEPTSGGTSRSQQHHSPFGDAPSGPGAAPHLPRGGCVRSDSDPVGMETITERWRERQQHFHCWNPQIKHPSHSSTGPYGQKHIENPMPKRSHVSKPALP